jgi:hypothetical protein
MIYEKNQIHQEKLKEFLHTIVEILPMATLTWTQVQTWFEKNAHKHKCVPLYIPNKDSIEGPDSKVDEYGWSTVSISPCTPLSAILVAQDALYNASPETARRALLRDETTDLQEKAVLHLKGRAWPVRKTAEGIASCGIEEGRATTWSDIGWRALCALRECQILVVNEDQKQLRFFPEDVTTWSSTVDTFCIDHECRSIATNEKGVHQISQWLSKKESEGWTIQWPISEGTMEQLKTELGKYNEILPIKCTKDVLLKKVGRAKSIHTFSSWCDGSNKIEE